MASETPYLRAVVPSLPSDISKKIRALCNTPDSSIEYLLDTLIRFVSGAECAPYSTTDTRIQWSEKQQAAIEALSNLVQRPSVEPKRQREDDTETISQLSKRPKPSVEDALQEPQEDALFTLHSVSATSPVRKKVDIIICKTTLRLVHSTTHAVEATVSILNLTRAFLLPTRGKQKPHWTVVLLSNDTTDRGKPTSTSVQLNPQVIFGLDAFAPSPLITTKHALSPSDQVISTVPKGSSTVSSIREFLSHLNIQILEPTPDVFKSVCTGAGTGVSANEDGVPGIEAYRGAKPGSLWFMKEGILWGESKPCEFWAVEDLIGKTEGLRVVNASGRTCSVILTRKSDSEEEVGEDEEDMGVETEFSLIDTREKGGIDGWVQKHRHLFGKKQVTAGLNIGQVEADSDDEDEDFEMDSDEVGDSSSSSSESSDEEEGSGGASDRDVEGSDGEGGEEEELKEENHPLMRPGAMPRMSKAAMNMVIGMMEEDVMGATDIRGEEDELEEDELED